MLNNTNDDDKKRREVWSAPQRALFLGSFLIFGGCQAQIFPGVNAVAQGSLFPVAATAVPATATPQPTVTQVVTPTASTDHANGPRACLGATTGGTICQSSRVTSTQSYSGPTPVMVSGTGQAQGKQFSDAFYLYSDAHGKAISPVHPKVNGLLCIDSKPIDSYVLTIPAYNPAHTYPVALNAPGGPLKFGACDVSTAFADNTGNFTITFD